MTPDNKQPGTWYSEGKFVYILRDTADDRGRPTLENEVCFGIQGGPGVSDKDLEYLAAHVADVLNKSSMPRGDLPPGFFRRSSGVVEKEAPDPSRYLLCEGPEVSFGASPPCSFLCNIYSDGWRHHKSCERMAAAQEK